MQCPPSGTVGHSVVCSFDAFVDMGISEQILDLCIYAVYQCIDVSVVNPYLRSSLSKLLWSQTK